MKQYLPLLLCTLLLTASPCDVVQAGEAAGKAETCRPPGAKTDCASGPAWCKNEDGTCSAEMRGRCGKRRGDWYGASQPVTSAAEARALILNYFAGRDYTVSDVTERKWGFRAEISDKNGTVIDRVMINKRSGRIRSMY